MQPETGGSVGGGGNSTLAMVRWVFIQHKQMRT